MCWYNISVIRQTTIRPIVAFDARAVVKPADTLKGGGLL
jgi:hypothetical protein